MNMKKNDKITATCVSYTFEGLGVVKVDNYPLFVKNLLVGETAEIVVTKCLKNYGFGKVLQILTPSDDRVLPACPIYKQCGGCQISHLSVKEQKKFKKEHVQDCITRIAKLDLQVEDVLTMDEPWNYRNKGQIPVGVKDGQVVCGFYRIHSNDIIDMDECHIQHSLINEIAQLCKQLLTKYQCAEYFRHLLIKVGFMSQQAMVVLIVNERNFPNRDKFVEELSQHKCVKSIILNLNQRNDNVILGDEEITLYGQDYIVDELNGLRFKISSKSFYQVNPVQTVNLYNKAVEFAQLEGNETVLDLYCGIGTITLFLAQKAKHVIGIEIVPEAIENAKENARLNKITNVEFECSDAASYAEKLANSGIKLDVISVDPPRKGCDDITKQSIIQMQPKRIVYVSCDPSTLARDLRYFEDHGYKAKIVQPVDMFPNSFHIENVCLIEKD